MKSEAAVALKEYNKGMKLRALLRDKDVTEVVSTLKAITPGVCEVGSFLVTFQTNQKAGEKSMQWRMNADYVRDRPAVDDTVPSTIVFGKLLESWPYTRLRGSDFDLTYADLFSFRGSAWLNDDAMRAFTVYLTRCKNNVTIFLPPCKKGKVERLPASTLEEVASGVVAQPFVLLLVNFGGVHWGVFLGGP
ncbi:hypothetical protein PHYPSEUDO_015460 [Phytophthora pseudosyringae]|uniref:Ubiquitin-like protease family profile domain-containing protein n=1 Tax=Phytophthora pseudosyringae TaxID=221518 RepID=A0A8T1V6L7_9STRA|nr:hypothetical protein PHYPSEUDO_015460 [Phytophthora pseudosyringae]